MTIVAVRRTFIAQCPITTTYMSGCRFSAEVDTEDEAWSRLFAHLQSSHRLIQTKDVDVE
jgi:predicted small metal-binding protein